MLQAMAEPEPTILVTLDGNRKKYSAGEYITGQCTFTVTPEPHWVAEPGDQIAETEAPYILVNLLGKVIVRLGGSKHATRWPVKSEHIFSISAEALCSGERQTIPFSIKLPSRMLPTFKDNWGWGSASIKYWMKFRLKSPKNWDLNLYKAEKAVRILKMTNVNDSKYAVPVKGWKETALCCGSGGAVSIEAEVDRSAYCSNDIVTINAKFMNRSQKTARPYAKLVCEEHYHAEGSTETEKSSWPLTPIGEVSGAVNLVGEGGSSTWNGVQFRIPEGLTSPSFDAEIIKISYRIEVGMEVPHIREPMIHLPIIIGTVPYKTEKAPIQAQPSISPAITEQPSGSLSSNRVEAVVEQHHNHKDDNISHE